MLDELTWSGPVERGQQGRDVRRLQEWLCLRDLAVDIDGVFGPATESAVRAFQRELGRAADGVVTKELFAALAAPMHEAVALPRVEHDDAGALVIACARRHLAQRPREVGGDNRGPWVRLYMHGHEGRPWRWCAGFVCFCLEQSFRALERPAPLLRTFSCDQLANQALRQGLLVEGDDPRARALLRPGCLFLQRRLIGDWSHVGIVTSLDEESFSTIEGNTDDGGGENGHEVAARIRAYRGRDFIAIGATALRLS